MKSDFSTPMPGRISLAAAIVRVVTLVAAGLIPEASPIGDSCVIPRYERNVSRGTRFKVGGHNQGSSAPQRLISRGTES